MKSLHLNPVVQVWIPRGGASRSLAQRFHAAADEAIRQQYARTSSRIKLLVRSWTWPVTAAVAGAVCVARFGPAVKRDLGLGLVRQWGEQWYLAMAHLVAPLDFYKFGLYRPERRANAEKYVFQREGIALMPIVNDQAIRWDKRWFAKSCTRFGLQHVPVVATFEAGQANPPLTEGELPAIDLFVKPTSLFHGRGSQRWLWRDGAFESDEGRRLTMPELIGYLGDLSREQAYLVQPIVSNHPEIARISNGSLSTIRMMTGLRKGASEPELIMAALRMGVGKSAVDNFGAGGIAAPVDNATGALGAAVSKNPSKPRQIIHPDTGRTIAGTTLPKWQQCVDLCFRAHIAFAPVAVVGWDVAVTTDGPILVEGNPTSCVELLQMSHERPLLSSAFGNIILSYF